MFSYPNQQKHNDMIDLMRGFANTGRPQVGIFWYDYAYNTLWGVQKDDADKYVDEGIGTIHKLHKDYWMKQHYRAIAKGDTSSIFYTETNYTQIFPPRTHLCMSGQKSICNRRTLDKRRNQRDTNCQCRCSP